jgi:4-amino-4-deoxy-L-arabinose transferase-like glycosyltransferase
VNRPTPAIVAQAAVRRLPRLVLLLLGMAYVLPGLLGRDPWRNADLASFGVMLDMARHAGQGSGNWLHPQVLGQAAEVQAWLPYWLGAAAIQALPWLSPDLAVRLPFGALLVLTLVATWYAMYHLARLPAAQPVSFAFGGEARPTDYARALADCALLALLASLGLAQLSHETTPDTSQLAFTALLLYACARLASAHAERRWLSTLVWWLGTVGLALSGAPWLGLVLGLGWLVWSAGSGTIQRFGPDRWLVWGVCATGTLVAALLAWELELPRRLEQWGQLGAWLHTDAWRRYGQLLLWFTWPVGLLAAWTLWRWRQRLASAHVLLPLWFVLAGMASAWLLGASDRALLMALPGLACLAAFALPTLGRSFTALIDWFALVFFSGCATIIWVIWLAMQTGVPAKPAANVAKLAPYFEPAFSWGLFLPAALATVAWVGLLLWRVGRHKPALWKSLVLSASGSTLCWLLLMTLWLPLLNHGMGQAPISRRIAAVAPADGCVLVHGLNHAQVTGLWFHGGLQIERARAGQASPCTLMVVNPPAYVTLSRVTDLSQWTLLSTVPRLRENRDGLMVFERH